MVPNHAKHHTFIFITAFEFSPRHVAGLRLRETQTRKCISSKFFFSKFKKNSKITVKCFLLQSFQMSGQETNVLQSHCSFVVKHVRVNPFTANVLLI